MPKTSSSMPQNLTRMNPGAAAIDIGSTMHMAAVNPDCADMPIRSFGTFTHDLHDLAAWFKSCGATSVAMESTGVYWIPVFEVLEQHGFEVILVNARYAKNVPGRKTDVSDAAWLRQLHSYGLLRGSFRPNAQVATLRAYGKPSTPESIGSSTRSDGKARRMPKSPSPRSTHPTLGKSSIAPPAGGDWDRLPPARHSKLLTPQNGRRTESS